jgi:acyl-coenzyme A thioesterase PaaI-like protein
MLGPKRLVHPSVVALLADGSLSRPSYGRSRRLVFALRASPWLRNEWGTVYGGILTPLAKSAAAAAVQTTAISGTEFDALDVKINFLRAVPADGRELLAADRAAPRQAAGDRHRRGDARRRPPGDPDGTTALTPPASP